MATAAIALTLCKAWKDIHDVPVDLAQGLAGADSSDLKQIEISPTGLGCWRRLRSA